LKIKKRQKYRLRFEFELINRQVFAHNFEIDVSFIAKYTNIDCEAKKFLESIQFHP